MGKKISIAARRELLGVVSDRYRESGRQDKVRILDEFVAVTGYHRKHAVRMFNAEPSNVTVRRAPRHLYDVAVQEALVVLWEASDRICGKRLKPLLPILIPALERHGHLRLDEAVRLKLFSVSAATMDRLLAHARAAGASRKRQGSKPAIRRSVAVRTFADWHDPLPGFMEADLVAHCGVTVSGSFVNTLVLTDIATAWTECVAIVVREGTLIVEALGRLQTTMPFPLRGFDTDNGSEFINELLLAYCAKHQVEFTRSRPYRKNDQAWVEQKNGSIVRRLVGYRRLEGLAAAEALARLYDASRLFVNFFQPSFKLAEKTRVGARVHKRYHPPATPCARLLALPSVPDAVKQRLREVAANLDPLKLLEEIRTVQHLLAGIAAGETPHAAAQRDVDLDAFLKGLSTAWQDGEVRPTHRVEPKPRRDWRTRADPFDAVWPRVMAWLDTEPDRTGQELFQRLQAENPGAFPDGQLRTLQRRLKDWRSAAAKRLVFGGRANADAPSTTSALPSNAPTPQSSTSASEVATLT